ncbi:MAG: SemiSWEET family transporter [Candidatus Levyibacteriota bacterium]
MDVIVLANVVGFTAGGLGVIMWLPQAIKLWKMKETKEISALSCIFLATSASLWLVYGILVSAMPVVLTNLAIFFLSLSILLLKRKYG